MKTIRTHEDGGPENLRIDDIAMPNPGKGEVRIRVKAIGINPMDWKICSGPPRKMLDLPLPLTPGGDVAGVIDAIGEGVDDWAVGDDVFSLIGLTGAYAEYVVVDSAVIARKPSAISFSEAASMPLVFLTALQGFEADGRNLDGLTVLVHNAAGGVGTAAVQIAKVNGARVIGTASEKNAEYVQSLGADEVIDFRTSPLEGRAQEIDIMMDLVGNEDATRLWQLVKPGGSVIRIAGGADAPKLAEDGGIRVIKIRVSPNGEQLKSIGALIESGALRTEIAEKFTFEQVAAAHALSKNGHVRGKIVLKLDG